MPRGNCLIAIKWWLESGRMGDLVISKSASGKAIHVAWAPYGVCQLGTWIKHRQPVHRYWDWRQLLHWWFEYEDYWETVEQCEKRIEREKLDGSKTRHRR